MISSLIEQARIVLSSKDPSDEQLRQAETGLSTYLEALATMADRVETVRENLTAYTMKDGREIHVIAQGALVNIAAADGHPVEIMDLSFSLQALSAEYLVSNRSIPGGVYPVPEAIDRSVAAIKLDSAGIVIDRETPAQKEYRQKDLIV